MRRGLVHVDDSIYVHVPIDIDGALNSACAA